ncbi:MAG: hypothetical protein UW74_C0034G0008 [Candidatus Giovannonibacteria bacterium GW2011_GWC2_44_8]|uniref:Uncharacterized protein n=3 Tax=Candidatus Giovannoniibacteriota TaxID=1752738 RepID=A0A1F5XC28_9BACT|nr:MAG: hypothetical protein UW74_C0034G0008 [Candidatus Giovannonibacteria bacterium GW2011_GWC2_44_8]OGF74346.1 MAG: hypothetical protein A2W57_03290 [Candidatus Giovannonibacteria bacterium RIFCSPHIGHO2_02_43_16]OGF85410.1 MAG: hypothetical protein A2Z63_02130 [Candidatus Giovannonibacteria bacterium RIFCSPLOWO2_02_44_8]
MTLTTHAIIGATAAQLFPTRPVLAFSAGFASHLVIDSLPHWDYALFSLKRDIKNPLNNDMAIGKNFVLDLMRISLDAFLGLLLSFFIFYYFLHTLPATLVLAGVIGGLLPDFLQFVYFKTRSNVLAPLQKFHIWIQEERELRVHPFIGISLQLALVIVVISFSFYLSA